jgi:hypothetical protein
MASQQTPFRVMKSVEVKNLPSRVYQHPILPMPFKKILRPNDPPTLKELQARERRKQRQRDEDERDTIVSQKLEAIRKANREFMFGPRDSWTR